MKSRRWDEFGLKKYVEAAAVAYMLALFYTIGNKISIYYTGNPWISEDGPFFIPLAVFLIYPRLMYRATASSFRAIKWYGIVPFITLACAAYIWFRDGGFTVESVAILAMVTIMAPVLIYGIKTLAFMVWYDHVGKYMDNE